MNIYLIVSIKHIIWFYYDNKSKMSVNPCEHRATIVAQAYLKLSKKGKKRDRTIFSFKHSIKNFDSVPKK